MNSPHEREKLPDLLSDALDATERARVESHLAGCEQCARELRALQRMQQTLAAHPVATPPASIRAGARAAISQLPNQAARADKQSWAVAALRNRREPQGRPNGQAEKQRGGAPRALPFALPARQLAWGGAVAFGAIGLMLLARPSLQNSPTNRTAPLSEADLAAKATPQTSAGAARDLNGAPGTDAFNAGADAPKTKGNAQRKRAESTKNGAANLPDLANNLPPLSAPPTSALPARPRAARPETLAPLPEFEEPSFAPFPGSAPTSTPRTTRETIRETARETGASQQQKSPDAPAPTTKPATKPAAPTRPNAPAQSPPAGVARPRQAPAPPRAKTQDEPPSAQFQSPTPPLFARKTENASSQAGDVGSAKSSEAPPEFARAEAQADAARAEARADSGSDAALAPPAMPRRAAPGNAAPGNAAPGNAGNSALRKSAEASDWTGGAVNARLTRGANAPVLTLSVALAIGNARLFLRLPQGQTQVWRGSLNAAPIEIKLPELAGLRHGQKIRAKLEQIDGQGNPKSSTNFDLIWP